MLHPGTICDFRNTVCYYAGDPSDLCTFRGLFHNISPICEISTILDLLRCFNPIFEERVLANGCVCFDATLSLAGLNEDGDLIMRGIVLQRPEGLTVNDIMLAAERRRTVLQELLKTDTDLSTVLFRPTIGNYKGQLFILAEASVYQRPQGWWDRYISSVRITKAIITPHNTTPMARHFEHPCFSSLEQVIAA